MPTLIVEDFEHGATEVTVGYGDLDRDAVVRMALGGDLEAAGWLSSHPAKSDRLTAELVKIARKFSEE